MLKGDALLLANPVAVLREEFEDAAVLFDPDTGEGYGLNPVGVFIWKLLDGKSYSTYLLMTRNGADGPCSSYWLRPKKVKW